MKTMPKFLTMFLVAVVCCAALSISVARADDGHGGGDDVNGTETFDVDLMMTPTSAAPAGATIELRLEAEDDHGATETELKLETHVLPAGTYNVLATLKSDGSTVAIGSFTLNSQGDFEVEFKNGETDDESGDDSGDDDNDEEELPLPANFNPFDIATVSVTDANNVVLFTADLSGTNTGSSASMNRNATVQAQPGPSDPNATGTAVLSAFMSSGKPKGSLQLNGASLPAKTKVSVLINGLTANVKKAATDKTGNISVRVTPNGKSNTVAPGVTLFGVTSIQLKDQAGNVMLSASF
jgi:hypothetical protein